MGRSKKEHKVYQRLTSEETMTAKQYDVVVFGATGYTGQFVAEEMAVISGIRGITFAIAGRSEAKLSKSIEMVKTNTGLALDTIPTIIADVSDENSLVDMAKKAS